MEKSKKIIFTFAAVGFGYLIYKKWKRQRLWWNRIHLTSPKLNSIFIIKTNEEANVKSLEILNFLENENVWFIGFDCEWVGKNKTGK